MSVSQSRISLCNSNYAIRIYMVCNSEGSFYKFSDFFIL